MTDSETRQTVGHMSRLLDGTLDRDLEELRLHLAFLERRLPPYLQREIGAEFGGTIAAELGGAPRPVPEAPDGIADGNGTQDAPG